MECTIACTKSFRNCLPFLNQKYVTIDIKYIEGFCIDWWFISVSVRHIFFQDKGGGGGAEHSCSFSENATNAVGRFYDTSPSLSPVHIDWQQQPFEILAF